MAKYLDLKARKILLALDMDARNTDAAIAKSVGLSKQSTNYRIKQLEKEIIQYYYPVIDHTKLGFQLYRIALKLENTPKEKEQEILNFLEKNSAWLVTILGEWDIWMAIYAQNEFGFMKFWNSFYEKYGCFVESRWISLMTKFTNLERSFIYPPKKNREHQFIVGASPQIEKIDKIDWKIMKELSKDARQTSLKIANRIDQTERIVRYRIKKIEDEKIILGYRTFVNTHLLGFKYYKLFIDLKDSKIQDIKKIQYYLTQNPNVAYLTEALGGHDLEIEVHLSDSQELVSFILALKEKFPINIKNISHMEYIKEYKISYLPVSASLLK